MNEAEIGRRPRWVRNSKLETARNITNLIHWGRSRMAVPASMAFVVECWTLTWAEVPN